MKLNTKYHGQLEYEEKDIITFVKGMCGFKKLKKYIIIPIKGNEMFSIMHSLENLEIGFIVVSPFSVEKNYTVNLDENITKELKIGEPTDVIILNTVTLSKDVQDITANLLAPIIINIKEGLGEQIILNNDKYSIKYPLFKE